MVAAPPRTFNGRRSIPTLARAQSHVWSTVWLRGQCTGTHPAVWSITNAHAPPHVGSSNTGKRCMRTARARRGDSANRCQRNESTREPSVQGPREFVATAHRQTALSQEQSTSSGLAGARTQA